MKMSKFVVSNKEKSLTQSWSRQDKSHVNVVTNNVRQIPMQWRCSAHSAKHLADWILEHGYLEVEQYLLKTYDGFFYAINNAF